MGGKQSRVSPLAHACVLLLLSREAMSVGVRRILGAMGVTRPFLISKNAKFGKNSFAWLFRRGPPALRVEDAILCHLRSIWLQAFVSFEINLVIGISEDAVHAG